MSVCDYHQTPSTVRSEHSSDINLIVRMPVTALEAMKQPDYVIAIDRREFDGHVCGKLLRPIYGESLVTLLIYIFCSITNERNRLALYMYMRTQTKKKKK